MDEREQFAINKWTHLDEYMPSFRGNSKTLAGRYRRKDDKFEPTPTTIDHPFMHELIKGLESNEQEYDFLDALRTVVLGGRYVPYDADDQILVLTATVPQLLEAYWRTFNG